jgi:hypothetical protein
MFKIFLTVILTAFLQGVDPTPTPTTPPTAFPLTATPTVTPTLPPTATPAPTLDPAVYPEQVDPSIYPTLVVTKLRESGLDLPKNGRSLFTLDNAYAKTSDPGFNLITIGKGARAKNFVLNVFLSWNQNGAKSACGVVFRSDLATSNNMVLLGVDKTLSIRQYVGESVPVSFQASLDTFDPDKSTALTIVALDDAIIVYVNGKRAAAQRMTEPILKGGFWLTVYNARDNLALTDCRFRNFWVWTFDPKE